MSVVIPAYNVEPFVAEAVDSALSQTYPHVEVVVVDDGSTDGTAAILAGYGDEIVLVMQPNRGVAGACNAGIRAASGEIVGLLAGDDVWHPERVARCVAVLQRCPEIGFVTTDATLIDASGRPLGGSYYEQVPFPTTRLAEAMARENRVFGNPLVWRHAYDDAGPFDETLIRGAEDYDMWLRFVERRIGMHSIPEELVSYRIRAGSLTRQRGGLSQPTMHVLERHLPILWRQGIYGSSNDALRIAMKLLREGEWKRATQFMTAAFRDPERNVLQVVGVAARGIVRTFESTIRRPVK